MPTCQCLSSAITYNSYGKGLTGIDVMVQVEATDREIKSLFLNQDVRYSQARRRALRSHSIYVRAREKRRQGHCCSDDVASMAPHINQELLSSYRCGDHLRTLQRNPCPVQYLGYFELRNVNLMTILTILNFECLGSRSEIMTIQNDRR